MIDGTSIAGAAFSLCVAFAATAAARRKPSYYDGEIYGMTIAHHRYIAGVAVIAAAAIVGIATVSATMGQVVTGVCTLLGILYLASFARGASEHE